MIFEVNISIDMLSNAINRAEKLGKINNSIEKGFGNVTGMLGEEVILSFISEATRDNNYNHDLRINGITYDVKSLRCNKRPMPEYLVFVSNTIQETQRYCFVFISTNYKKAWIVGYIKKEDFISLAEYRKAGDRESNGYLYKTDCYVLPICKLSQFC